MDFGCLGDTFWIPWMDFGCLGDIFGIPGMDFDTLDGFGWSLG